MASTELAALWHAPSIDYATVPFARSALPLAPAPPAIMRPREGEGLLRDAHGPVAIHPQMRRQNTAVPGAVEQGKSSYLAATVAEDLRRERCAVIVLDPKGDAAEAAVSAVPAQRTCTLLDFAHPTCGFNPLAVDAPADTIADYVVGALKNLFTDADIRASSDRYLRNAIIAVLAHDRRSTLWDAARLLTVGEEGYAYRARVGAHVRTLPEYKEIAEFFTAELAAQLADSRSTTTAKLDAPVNKLARLLNSPSIKRVLLNDSLTVDLDRVIAGGEVLVVKGALGAMGAGNTSVLMQLLMGMLDAALARQQDTVPAEQRVAVALKVDEAPLVLNRGFAETLALKRSAGSGDRGVLAGGLAVDRPRGACAARCAVCPPRVLRHRLRAGRARRRELDDGGVLRHRAPQHHRASPRSGHPDARLHLPKHHAIASWVAPEGRQAPFLASTIPLRIDHERLALHAARQAERGGRYLADLSQPHWERREAGRARGGVRERPRARGGASRLGRASSATTWGEGEGGEAEIVRAGGRGDTGAGATGASVPRERAAGRRGRGALPATAAESERHPALTQPPGACRRARLGHRCPTPPRRATPSWWASTRPTACAGRGRPPRPAALDPDPLDLEVLALIASMRHVLTSQIHRRFNPRAGGHHHPAAPEAPLRRRPRGALPVPSPRRGRGAHVLRDRPPRTRAAGRARASGCPRPARGRRGTRNPSPQIQSLSHPSRSPHRHRPRCPSRAIGGCAKPATRCTSPGGCSRWSVPSAPARCGCGARGSRCSRRRCAPPPPGASRSAPANCACREGAPRTTSCAPTPPAPAWRSSASRPCAPTRASRCPAGRSSAPVPVSVGPPDAGRWSRRWRCR